MDQEHGPSETEDVNEEVKLEPREAMTLLEETTSSAQRQFNVWPPYLLFIGALIFLVAYGAVWLSVRGQHPYGGPSGGALAVLYGCILIWIVVATSVGRRATRGVSGETKRHRSYRAGYLAIIVGYNSFLGALYHAGASNSIVYGIFPASVPWLFLGTVFITIGALRLDGRSLVGGILAIGIGIGGAFAGPVVAWLVSGIGICLALAGFAVFQAVERRV